MYVSMLETESDREVFRRLYEKNRQRLYYTAWKIVQNDDNAEDAVHTCFMRLADRYGRYRDQPFENLEKLCRVIVVNEATNITRAYARRGEFLDVCEMGEDSLVDDAADILDQLIVKYDRELLSQALRQLTPDERHFLALQYELDIKPKDIGAMMNMTSGAVRKKILRCRRKLAEILEDEKYESLR